MTLRPEQLTAADGEALRAAGISDSAIAQAVYICRPFKVGNRAGDAFGVEAPPSECAREGDVVRALAMPAVSEARFRG